MIHRQFGKLPARGSPYLSSLRAGSLNGARCVAAALLALSTAACSRTVDLSYRLTVSVNDNGIQHVGTGVWRVSLMEFRSLTGVRSYHGSVSGDAIPIVLPHRGVVLVLPAGLSTGLGDVASMLPERVFGREVQANYNDRVATLQRINKLKGHTKLLDCNYARDNSITAFGPAAIPQLQRSRQCLKIAFTDRPADPARFRTIDFSSDGDAPKGVSIERVEMEITDAVPGHSIDRILPWIPANPGLQVTGPGEPNAEWYKQYLRRHE